MEPYVLMDLINYLHSLSFDITSYDQSVHLPSFLYPFKSFCHLCTSTFFNEEQIKLNCEFVQCTSI